jgi:hypothetical protein
MYNQGRRYLLASNADWVVTKSFAELSLFSLLSPNKWLTRTSKLEITSYFYICVYITPSSHLVRTVSLNNLRINHLFICFVSHTKVFTLIFAYKTFIMSPANKPAKFGMTDRYIRIQSKSREKSACILI